MKPFRKPSDTEINLVAEAISQEKWCSICVGTKPKDEHCNACTNEAMVAIAAFLKARKRK